MKTSIDVDKNVFFLPAEKVWSISLRTPKPYGEFYPRTIYISAIFHKKLDKALNMAWKEFYKSKEFQDNKDEFYRSKQSETVKVAV